MLKRSSEKEQVSDGTHESTCLESALW